MGQRPMTEDNIDLFGKLLVTEVRDESIRLADQILSLNPKDAVARRWRAAGVDPATVTTIVPDVVDEVLGVLLDAIDNERLRLKWVKDDGEEIDLSQAGMGELLGRYLGRGGWRATNSSQRWPRDFEG